MSVFDVPLTAIPECLQRHLGEANAGTEGIHGFMKVAPLKMLHKVYEMWQEVPYTLTTSEPCSIHSHEIWDMPRIMYASGRDFEAEAAYRQAVKSDDAQVPVHLWNNRIGNSNLHQGICVEAFHKRFHKCPLDSLRGAFLRSWQRLVTKSLLTYLKTTYGEHWQAHPADPPSLRADLACGRDWWEWRGGSSLLFWRWPPEFQKTARDGHPIWVLDDLPNYKRPQWQEPDSETHQ